MPAKRRQAPPKRLAPNASPEERARAAIAKEEPLPGDRVRLTFRLVLARRDAEALAARAIQEEKNLPALVEEILETAVRARPMIAWPSADELEAWVGLASLAPAGRLMWRARK